MEPVELSVLPEVMVKRHEIYLYKNILPFVK